MVALLTAVSVAAGCGKGVTRQPREGYIIQLNQYPWIAGHMQILKKYPNRRIYDTENSCYITVADVRRMVVERKRFQVIDSKTGKDLTRSVLLQVIAEMEAEGHESLLTNRVLEELIRFYGDRMVGMLGPFLERQVVGFLAQQDSMREYLRVLSAGKAPLTGLPSMELTDKVVETLTRRYQQVLQPFSRKEKKPRSKTVAKDKENPPGDE